MKKHLRLIEEVKQQMPSYLALWSEMAGKYLEELRPNECQELTEQGELETRCETMAQDTERALLMLLEKGEPLESALIAAQELTLHVAPEPDQHGP